ncbi:MAG: DUF2442 domain-containing protein [Gammaproteobacteria bacterium]|nr:DUF2442 domain-containing protein [Gammaproteobacteria bacterium]MBU1647618.1 DUF2442 domain-containing protein [Gammaproteobacteria bacterium]MBU1971507.1 DUF2442 domain-containing protein [Gammaproteobacteria bacterium]
MIKVLSVSYIGEFNLALHFSDGKEGVFDGRALLQRKGPLLDALRQEEFFRRAFIDMGAVCWPNGLELSPARLYETCLKPEHV